MQSCRRVPATAWRSSGVIGALPEQIVQRPDRAPDVAVVDAAEIGLQRAAAGRQHDRRGQIGKTGHEMLRRLRSEEHTSELQSLMRISYAVFCLKKKKKQDKRTQQMIKALI